MKRRLQVVALAVAMVTLGLSPLGPDRAWAACQQPLADARTLQPTNGTGGFSVFGAPTLPQLGFSVGVGYMGEQAVCQNLDDDFDFNTVWLAVGFGITDRLQALLDVPYSWYEADKANFSGDGIEDINFGLLYRLIDESGNIPAIGVVGFAAAPTGDRAEGIGRNEWDVGAKLVLSKTLPLGLLSHFNVGYTYAGRGGVKQEDIVTLGAALEYPINKYFSVVAEGLPTPTGGRMTSPSRTGWPRPGPGSG